MSDVPPSETRVVDVNGVPIEVRRIGTGPDVLFIHGVYVTGHVWDDLVAQLADRFTCWVPTMPLGAHSVPAPAAWQPTMDDLGRLVPGLIEALDLSDVTLVGNDSGGGFVLLALGSNDVALSRIGRVVLTNCDSYDHLPPPGFNPIIKLCSALPIAGRGLLRLMLRTSVGQKQFMKAVAVTPVSTERRKQIFGSPPSLKDAVRVTAALTPTPAQQEMAWLSDVKLPVAIVWGDGDKFFPKSDADRLRAGIPGATLIRLADARTYLQIDDPETVAKAIEASYGSAR
jgi:pimeloyl-ACP methyl ester carboxylesterase